MRRKMVVLLVAALAGTGCGGPRSPLEIGVKEISSDVVLGAQKRAATPVPLPPAVLEVPPPGFSTPGVRTPATEPPSGPGAPTSTAAPRPPCPEDDPLVFPKLGSTNAISALPAPGIYPYRTSGSYEITGASAAKGTFPGTSSREVKNVVRAGDGSVSFDVAVTLGKDTTTTSYSVVPSSPVPPNPYTDMAPTPDGSGLFVTKIASVSGTFSPSPPMLVLPFPAEKGRRWQVVASDPVSQQAMAYNGTVEGRTRVNGCGVPLDTIKVRLDGELRQCTPATPTPPAGPPPPGQQCPAVQGPGAPSARPSGASAVTFVADYAFATQYGGISLEDTVTTTGTDAGQGVTKTLHSTIDVEPVRPR
jgi:hypothetical protein